MLQFIISVVGGAAMGFIFNPAISKVLAAVKAKIPFLKK